jgi:hypothetical protein
MNLRVLFVAGLVTLGVLAAPQAQAADYTSAGNARPDGGGGAGGTNSHQYVSC